MDLEVIRKSPDSLTVRWAPSPGSVSGYRITSLPHDQQGDTFSEVVGPGMLLGWGGYILCVCVCVCVCVYIYIYIYSPRRHLVLVLLPQA